MAQPKTPNFISITQQTKTDEKKKPENERMIRLSWPKNSKSLFGAREFVLHEKSGVHQMIYESYKGQNPKLVTFGGPDVVTADQDISYQDVFQNLADFWNNLDSLTAEGGSVAEAWSIVRQTEFPWNMTIRHRDHEDTDKNFHIVEWETYGEWLDAVNRQDEFNDPVELDAGFQCHIQYNANDNQYVFTTGYHMEQ